MINNILDVCVICSKKEELVDHLFLHCVVAYSYVAISSVSVG